MPWHIQTRIEDDETRYCVVEGESPDDAGETLECYADEEEAEDYLEALYANTDEEMGKRDLAKREYKAAPTFTKEIDDRTVVGIFAVHGNIDQGNDRSWPGAFSDVKVSGRNRVRFVWQHSPFDPPVAAVNYVRDIPKNELPPSVLEYAPDATGGAEVSRTYLDTPRGNEILAGIKAGAIEEMSYSYDVMKFDFEDVDGRQVRNLRKLALYDVSDVLWGLNPATVAVKGWQVSSLPFTEHSDSVVLLLDEFVRRAKDRAVFRAKEGRVLSSQNRSRITRLVESLEEVTGDLKELLAETEPKAARSEVVRLMAEWERTKSQLQGVFT